MYAVFEGSWDAVLRVGVPGPGAALGRALHAAGEQAADGAGRQRRRAGEGRRHGLAAGETLRSLGEGRRHGLASGKTLQLRSTRLYSTLLYSPLHTFYSTIKLLYSLYN